jgi:hypothetical protein
MLQNMMVFFVSTLKTVFYMKPMLLLLYAALLAAACNNSSSQITLLQNKVDSLQKEVNNSYKPGLGEFMSSIQVHHAKLYFAGQNNNWKLADFEIHEIMEAIDDIQHYASDRPEVKELPMLLPALDSVNAAIARQDKNVFNRNFITLTNTCNACHTAVNYNFNMVKIPSTPPFSNQLFSVEKTDSISPR